MDNNKMDGKEKMMHEAEQLYWREEGEKAYQAKKDENKEIELTKEEIKKIIQGLEIAGKETWIYDALIQQFKELLESSMTAEDRKSNFFFAGFTERVFAIASEEGRKLGYDGEIGKDPFFVLSSDLTKKVFEDEVLRNRTAEIAKEAVEKYIHKTQGIDKIEKN